MTSESASHPPAETDSPKRTFFILTEDWSGLHQMFEKESFEAMAGVPLVPMFWNRLAQRGHEVHVFVVGDFSSSKTFAMGGFTVHRLRRPGWITGAVKGRLIRSVLKFSWAWAQISFARAARRVARTSRPDVIYSYRSGTASVGHRLARRYDAVHVGRHWGTWLSQVLQAPWYTRLRSLGEILSYRIPYDLFIMTNDGTLGNQVARRLKFPMQKHRFWLDGTSPDIYMPDLDKAAVKRSVGLQADQPMIFGVARLDFWKRFDRAIGAMPEVLQAVPGARLVIAGDGPLRGELEAQIEHLGLQGKVILLGSVPHDRVRELHNAADIFVTVQDLTNLGNQIMEAMHSGSCVVAYDTGGTRDVARDGENCVLLSQSQLPDLGKTIAQLLCDHNRRNRLAQGALEYARKNIWFWPQRLDVEIQEVLRLVEAKRQAR